jgi:drug/metabolite transporter (DMT)-like permease
MNLTSGVKMFHHFFAATRGHAARRREAVAWAASGEGLGARPALNLAIVVFAWGGNYTWVKLGLADIGPWAFNAFRYGLAAVVLGGWLAVRDGPGALLPLPGERAAIAVTGLLQVVVMTACTTLSLDRVEASRTVLIAYTMPVWSMIFGRAVAGERAGAPSLLPALLGLTGLALLFSPWAMDWTTRDALIGSALALGGTWAWAVGALLYRRRAWRSPMWRQVSGQILPSAVVMTVLALLFETRGATPTPRLGAILAWNALVPTILGFRCWAKALERLPVSTASQVLLLSPVLGVALSALVLGERVTLMLGLAAALTLAGSLLALRRP